jgi:uncharacterized protein
MFRQLFIGLFLLNTIVVFAQTQNNKSVVKPLVVGEVHQIQSAILNETRTLNIYLPDGYNTKDSIKYPVVYLLDGGIEEDFIHIVGLYQFNSFEWINTVPPSIIVGIANVDRIRDLTHLTSDTADARRYPTAGHSELFINFIENELQPYIQQKFKTASSKTLIGESLGGLLATEILLKKPTLFTTYIIVSPSLWWDDGSLLKLNSPIFDETYIQPTHIYIGVGREGLAPGDKPHVMEVDVNLLAEKISATKSKSIVVSFDYLPFENHATVMHQAVFNALRLIQNQSLIKK